MRAPHLVVLAGLLSVSAGCSGGPQWVMPNPDPGSQTTNVTGPPQAPPPAEAKAAAKISGVDAASRVAEAAGLMDGAGQVLSGSQTPGAYTGQVPGPPFRVAQAVSASVPVYDRAGASAPRLSLSNPNDDGSQRVFLVVVRQADWLQVLLPTRPNGSLGWIRAGDVTLRQHSYHVLVELGGHQITVWNGSQVIDHEPIGVGTASSPTPGGVYYVTEVLQAPDPGGPYGPFALGLSGYSNIYHSFNGGDGAIGIHGTNEPWAIGRDVSHGCIRMSNSGVTTLAHTLPLGTPVFIAA